MNSTREIIEQTGAFISRIVDVETGRKQKATETLMNALEQLIEQLANDFNSTTAHEPLMISVRRSDAHTARTPVLRLLVSTSFYALSIRASRGVVEFFALPSTELPSLQESELPSRLKLKLQIASSQNQTWSMDGSPINQEELGTLVRALIKDMITRSQGDFEVLPESLRLVAGGQSLTRSVRSLMAEKHSLVQKIVNQQEAIQNQVARELHDAVLGNVMLLKRALASGQTMMVTEVVTLLDEIEYRLREVCQELFPRDLKDCGLLPMLEELCDNFSARTGCDCKLNGDFELPEFPHEVSLHIYRIAQECLNNVAKHASASRVDLVLSLEAGTFTMIIKDNGKGFDAAPQAGRTKDGGSGTSIIRERAELINCIYPSRVWIDSDPDSGTKVTLEIRYALNASATDTSAG